MDASLHLRGGSFAADGPNFARAIRSPAAGRTRTRRRRQQQQHHHQHEQEDEDEDGPANPSNSAAYEPAPKTAQHARRARALGIRESLLRPAADPGPGPDPNAGRPWSGWVEWLAGAGAVRQRGLEELTGGEWRPTRTRFAVVGGSGSDHDDGDRDGGGGCGDWGGLWPRDGELGSKWYEGVYGDLFEKVRGFAGGYFGYGDFGGASSAGGGGDGERKGAVWVGGGFSELFRWFVGQVAMQDNNAGGWDVLVTKKVHRECLVAGVVGKVLETEVFDDLLFGADKAEKSMLAAQDECTLEFEGYHRTNLRSQCVRTLLADDILTPEFWPCVDQLTLQITTLLLPLLGLMDKHFPPSQAKSLRSFYQDLHAIVALAGYLSLGIRWSRNIFRFSLPFPGEGWDLDQEHVDDSIYKASEVANKRADMAAEHKWRGERDQRRAKQRERQARSGHSTFRDRGEAAVASARRQLKAVRRRITGRGHEDDSDHGSGTNDAWHRRSRMGKVQIVLWPMLQRFETVGDIDLDTGTAGGEKITTVFKSQVVYYYGRIGEPGGDSDHFPSLDEWLLEARRKRAWNAVVPPRWAAYAVVAWLLLSFLARYDPMLEETLQHVRLGLVEIAMYVAREAALFVLEILITAIAILIGASKLLLFLGFATRNTLARLMLSGQRLFSGGFGGLSGSNPLGNGTQVYSSGLVYPDLSWESIKGIARTFAGQLIWKPFTVQVPVGYTMGTTFTAE